MATHSSLKSPKPLTSLHLIQIRAWNFGLGNVPLNDQLASLSVNDAGAAEMWDRYVARWTAWNHVRTVAAMVAALLYTLGLIQSGGS